MKRKVADLSILESLQQPKQQQQPPPIFFAVNRKFRSKLPQRRRRYQISPILNSVFTNNNSSSYITKEELSCECDSSRASVNKRVLEKERIKEFRRAARESFYNNKREYVDVEVSESSCVESCSGAVSDDRESKLKKGIEIEIENEIVSVERFSEIIAADKLKKNGNSVKFSQQEVISEVTEDLETVNESDIASEFSKNISKIGAEEVKRPQYSVELNSNDVVSLNSVMSNFQKSLAETEQKTESRAEDERGSDAKRGKELVPIGLEFTCSENFSNDGVSDEYDYSSAYSELQSEIFPESSDIDLSEYTPSIWYDSGSQFSEKSNESPSPTFQLFLQFSREFCKSNIALESNSSAFNSLIEDNDSHEITLLGLEDEEDQESFNMLRSRERKQIYLHDYAVEYCSSTDYGDLIIQQRLHMVHWIFEQSTDKELQRETMFLGVNLLDRFLSKGYFRTKRNLQIAGIACVTLATRIEENQPYNSVRQKMFHIGSNTYSRCEVVAMEWLVQEVLKFQCFLPTMYNFIWYYLKAARASERLEKTVNHLAVVALLGHEQLCYWPSTVAAGLVILASIASNQEASCYTVTETHARMKDDDLPECIKSLAWLVTYIR